MKNTSIRSVVAFASTIFAVAGLLAGCSSDSSSGESSSDESSEEAFTIGLLLPESETTRYETFDRPLIEQELAELGNYTVSYQNANQDAATQQTQAEAMIAEGVDVLILDPVDVSAAATIVASAVAADIPVVSYDRLIDSTDLAFYVSFDNEMVGELQGQTLVDYLDSTGAEGGIIMINGSPTDSNATLFKDGAHSVIDDSGYEVLAEYDAPEWSAEDAQDWTAQQITLYGDEIVAVYAANDGVAGGAIAALQAASFSPWPVITGQDAELAAIQRIVNGDQYMTVYKSISQEAETVAKAVHEIITTGSATGESEDTDGVPTTLLEPVSVTIDNIAETVVADGFWSIEDICTDEYADACEAAGLTE